MHSPPGSVEDRREDPAEDTVLYHVDDGVALITLNRPERLNALIRPMRIRFLELLAQAGADPAVRVVVVTGAGRGFCVGADRDYLATVDSEKVRSIQAETTVALDVALTIEKPVIGAINGAAAGLGLTYALMTDVRFAAEDARFTTAFASLGLVAEGGLSWLLPRIVGTARALDLLYSARVFAGTEANQMGLVQWVSPAGRVLPEALVYARTLARNSAYSLANMRRQVYGDWSRTWTESFEATRALVAESVARPEFTAAIEAARRRADDDTGRQSAGQRRNLRD